jgi:hypothetical protein
MTKRLPQKKHVTGIPRPLRNIPFLMVVMGIDIYFSGGFPWISYV